MGVTTGLGEQLDLQIGFWEASQRHETGHPNPLAGLQPGKWLMMFSLTREESWAGQRSDQQGGNGERQSQKKEQFEHVALAF